MDWLLDTNLALRFSDKSSRLHEKACKSLAMLFERGELLHLTSQNLIEFWAVATRPESANGLGWTCAEAEGWIAQLLEQFLFLDDLNTIFPEWRALVCKLAIAGRRVHDARLVAVMKVHRIPNLLTFNSADFASFSDIQVIHPDDVIAGRA